MKSVLLLLTVLFVQSVEAGIMPASSRIIYRDGDRETTLMLVNTNDYPVLVQSWVDNGEGSPEAASPLCGAATGFPPGSETNPRVADYL